MSSVQFQTPAGKFPVRRVVEIDEKGKVVRELKCVRVDYVSVDDGHQLDLTVKKEK